MGYFRKTNFDEAGDYAGQTRADKISNLSAQPTKV